MNNREYSTRDNRSSDNRSNYDDRDNRDYRGRDHRDRDDRGDRQDDRRRSDRRGRDVDSRDPRDHPYDGRNHNRDHSRKRRRDDSDNNYTGPRRGGAELNVLRDIRTALNFQNRLLQQLAMSGGVPEENVQFSYRGGNKTVEQNPPRNYSPSSSPLSDREDRDEDDN